MQASPLVLRPRFATLRTNGVLILLALAAPLARADAAPASADPLTRANADFRALYRDAKVRALASAGPVLLVEGDTLVLRDGARRDAVPFLPAGSTALKEVSHLPLALHVLLHDREGPLDGATRTALQGLASHARSARTALGARAFPRGSLARQEQVIDASLELVDGIVARGAVARGEVAAFARRMGPLVEANASDAAALQLDALHGQVSAWRARVGAAWPRLHVIVMGAHMARTNEISLQYFQRLLGEPREGGRVVFAEGLWDEEKALDLLATHLVDTAASDAFFGDPERLHEDMLAPGARRHLELHPPK